MAEVCRTVFDDIAAVTLRINGIIERSIRDFAPSESPFTHEDRFRSSRGMIAGFLQAVAENRDIHERDIAFAHLVGQQSALKGFPLPPLIDSLYTAYREVWAELVAAAGRAPGTADELLREAGATIWERMHALTTAVTAGYHRQMPRPEALEIRIAGQFVKAIATDPASEEARSLAIDLGFNAEGSFRVAAIAEPAAAVEASRRIARAAQMAGAVAIAAARGGASVLVVQGMREDDLAALIAREASEAPAGMSLTAESIGGIGAALTQAECALRLAGHGGGLRRFADEWFLAAPLIMREDMERLLRPAIELCRSKPHLASAVRAFSAHGFSLAAAAGELAVTQSTVRYRLKRWHAITAWDPWTFHGLANSILAFELAGTSR